MYVLFFQCSNELIFKIKKIECFPNWKHVVNHSCTLKAVSWTKAMANMDADLVKPVRNVTVNPISFNILLIIYVLVY